MVTTIGMPRNTYSEQTSELEQTRNLFCDRAAIAVMVNYVDVSVAAHKR